MSEPTNRAVFLSYASQDTEAAKRICEALRAAGVEVWFDQSELVGGDAWDQKIRKQIRDCALLIPLISQNTQTRAEGYFRLEWRLADQRTHLMGRNKAFLLPVAIDGTTEADADVPDSFTAVQWTKAPGGEVAPAFAQRVKKLLSGESEGVGAALRRDSSDGSGHKAPPTANRPGASKWWWVLPIFGVTMALILVLKEGQKVPTPSRAGSDVPESKISPARQLANRAAAILDDPGEKSSTNLGAAAALCEQAEALDPSDAEIWAVAARLHSTIFWLRFDASDEQRQRAQQAAAKAIALAPNSRSARRAQAYVFASVVATPESIAEAEKVIRGLLRETPGDKELSGELAITVLRQERIDEAVTLFEKADSLISAGWVLFATGRFVEANKVADRLLARERSAGALYLKAHVELFGFQDLAAAQRTIGELPPAEAQTENGASIALFVAYCRRDPEKMLRVLAAYPQNFLTKQGFYGPKRMWTGVAQELAGHREAAESEWTVALQQVVDRRKDRPGDIDLLLSEALLRAQLGQPEASEKTYRLYLNLADSVAKERENFSLSWILLRLGRREEALASLSASWKAKNPGWENDHACARLCPIFDPLRGDPRFEKLLRDTLPPGAKPFDDAQGRPSDDQKTEDGGQKSVLSLSLSTPPDAKSVAVLAFANLSDEKANEYFSDGISEELLNVLAKIPGLKVAARTSAFYFKGKEVPVPEIAKQLGVAYVVEGSVRKQGDKVRITAQLIKAADGFHVWSDTFTRDIKDVFAVQDEIAGLIAKNLELKMGIGDAGARQEVSPEAYQEYLLGRAAFAKASMAGLREAVTHFDRAVALEPKYTAAWVQLASTHTRLGRWGGAPTRQAWAAARVAIDRARALEPDSPEVLLALGWILRTGEWNWREAERAFRRALALQPNQPEILAGAAVLLYNIGQTDEAFRLARQAIQLDPLNAGTQIDLSLMFFMNRNWAEAERSARRALQLAPGGTSYHCILAWSLIAQQRYPEAEAEINLDQSEDGVDRTVTLGLLAVARGQDRVARDWLARLEEITRTNGDLADLQQNIAWLNTSLGDKDRAFAALEKAYTSRDPSMSWLLNSWWLQPLASDPRWPALVRKVGLTDEQLK